MIVGQQDTVLDGPVSKLIVRDQGSGVDLDDAGLGAGQVARVDGDLPRHLIGTPHHSHGIASQHFVDQESGLRLG
jgi:hypothetical protein